MKAEEYKEKIRELEAKNKVLSAIYDTWLYGLSKIGREEDSGVARIIRRIQSEAVKHWVYDLLGIKLPRTRDPVKACEKYVEIMDRQGFMQKKLFKFSKKGRKIVCTISAPCVYFKICKTLLDEGVEPLCLRTQPFITVIEEMAGKKYIEMPTLINPERKCIIELQEK